MLHLYYGGTFDPFHNGHLAIARAARDCLGTEVHLMPAADPPHRAAPGASAEQRAAMLERVAAGEPGLWVDRRELRRAQRDPQARSYTIDTLHELRDELGPRQPIALLIGADSLVSLATWRDWQAMFELTHFVVAERPGSSIEGGLSVELQRWLDGRWADEAADLNAQPYGRVFRLQHPLHPESATDIRRRIAGGQPWRELVPPSVAAFIAVNGLYLASAV